MSPAALALAHRGVLLAAGAAVLAATPIAAPAPALPLAASLAVGTTAATSLFAALGRSVQPPPLLRPRVLRIVALATPLLAASALAEEAVWRYLALGGLRPLLGPVAALATSSAAFALAHARAGARAASVHLATGATFGAVYLGTGRLAAAVAAHLLYNILVVAARIAWAPPRESLPTG